MKKRLDTYIEKTNIRKKAVAERRSGIWNLHTRYVSKLPKQLVSIDIRERHKVLLDLEGWYETEAYQDIPIILTELYRKYNGRGKITRWLVNNGHCTSDEASRFNIHSSVKFKLSCRHNDILRVAETHHYQTCFREEGRGGEQVLKYLADRDMGVIFVPDKSGKFIFRMFVRLCTLTPGDNNYCLVLYRHYGNGPHDAISTKLAEILPVYKAGRKLTDNDTVMLHSASKISNPCVEHATWSDHDVRVNDNRLMIHGSLLTD